MRILMPLILGLGLVSQAHAETLKEQLIRVVKERVGAPGENFGEKSNLMVVEADGNVTFIFLCSAGKEGGVGDQIVDASFSAINGATAGSATLIERAAKRIISKGVVNKGDAFCVAAAVRTGTGKKAKNVSKGSIYTTSWKGGEKVKSVTDRSACKKIQNRYLCFEVAEAPESSGEVDGVSGCFQAKVDGNFVSYSFGRGASIPEEVQTSFLAENSKSEVGCVERGLGQEEH